MIDILEEVTKIQDNVFESAVNVTNWLLMSEIGELLNGNIKAEYNEFRRIEFKLSRRMGNTTIAGRLMHHFDNAFFFTYNVCMAESFSKEFGINRKRVFSIRSENKISGLRFDVAIVDPASMISKSLIEGLYYYRPKAIILLG